MVKNIMKTKIWQTRVKITQIPSSLEKQKILNPKTKQLIEIEKSWLFDPFLDQTVYGVEISLNRDFSWVFFLKSGSKSEAFRKGYSLLMFLEENFPGLSGEVSVLPVTEFILKQEFPIYELVIPNGPYKGLYYEQDRFYIIKKISHLFQRNTGNFIQFFILWQKDDSVNHVKYGKTSISELYKLKIFVRIIVDKESFSEKKLSTSKLVGQLEYLTMDIKNILGERANFKEIYHNTWENILTNDVFWVNHHDEHTGAKYSYIKKKLPEERVPTFISPGQLDFTFSEDLPLHKAFSLPNENINYLPISKKRESQILLGKVVNKGVLTNNKKSLPIDHFAHSVFIAGQINAGKTSFLGHICKEFYIKAPEIGILILNLGKGRQEGFYKTDIVLKFGSPELRIPYYFEGEYLDKALQETATYLVSALGLRSPCDKILYLVLKSFIRVNGCTPKSLKTLFKGLRKWFREHKYHKKFQTNILRAIQNRVLTLLSNPVLEKTLELTPDFEIPKWFQEWKTGKIVFIDLSMCNIYLKRLLSFAIFQMVKTLTPDIEAGNLQNIIIIDEAHQITEKPITTNPDDDDFISREQLEKIFSSLLREFRSKGLSLIIADQTPHRLFSCVTALPNLKILFRLSHLDNEMFTHNHEIQEYLTLQKNRHAIIMNGNNEEIFIIKTIDYFYSI